MSVIGNLCPETVEEAKAVVPSIAVRFEIITLSLDFRAVYIVVTSSFV